MRNVRRFCAVWAVATVCGANGWADDKAQYEKRAIARYTQLFAALDRNADGIVTRDEARGDLNFIPAFDDMDINRDRAVTKQELERYLQRQFR
jgi:Ca2+-binding EF-hand superfamily protein